MPERAGDGDDGAQVEPVLADQRGRPVDRLGVALGVDGSSGSACGRPMVARSRGPRRGRSRRARPGHGRVSVRGPPSSSASSSPTGRLEEVEVLRSRRPARDEGSSPGRADVAHVTREHAVLGARVVDDHQRAVARRAAAATPVDLAAARQLDPHARARACRRRRATSSASPDRDRVARRTRATGWATSSCAATSATSMPSRSTCCAPASASDVALGTGQLVGGLGDVDPDPDDDGRRLPGGQRHHLGEDAADLAHGPQPSTSVSAGTSRSLGHLSTAGTPAVARSALTAPSPASSGSQPSDVAGDRRADDEAAGQRRPRRASPTCGPPARGPRPGARRRARSRPATTPGRRAASATRSVLVDAVHVDHLDARERPGGASRSDGARRHAERSGRSAQPRDGHGAHRLSPRLWEPDTPTRATPVIAPARAWWASTTSLGRVTDTTASPRDGPAHARPPSSPTSPRATSAAVTPPSRHAVDKQHARGKKTARERIEQLLDEGSFTELDAFVRHRSTNFGLDKKRIAGDGVVVGHGTVDGRPVAIYSQDFTVFGGSLGEVHGQKITKVMDLALRTGRPAHRHQRRRRRAHPGGRRGPHAVRGDLPPQRRRVRRDPADQPHPRPVARAARCTPPR